MAVPTHLRFVVRGGFNGTPEEWSTSCKFSRDNPAGADAELGDVHEAETDTAVATFFGSVMWPSAVVVKDWRWYVIGTDNKMQGNGPKLREYAPNEVHGTGSNKYPPQISVVASTVAVNRGPAQFGRMYLPPPAVSMDAGMRLSAADAAGIAGLTAQFLKDLSDAIDLEGLQSSEGLHISKGPVGSSTGTRQTIDHVRVGRVFDTVRNRRKSLLEEYESAPHIDW